MKLIHVLAGASFAMLLGPVTSLAGSYPQRHHSFFLGFNLGAGASDVRYTEGESVRRSGGAANLRIGGAVINDVLLSAELTGWLWKEDGHPIGIANALFALTWFPAGGFFVRAGMGWGDTHFLETTPTGHVATSKDEVGTSFGFATGYEWRLTKKFALGPQVEYTWVNIGGDLIDKASYASTTLGFNWYW